MITAAEIVTQLNPEGKDTKFQSAPVIDAVNRAILSGGAIMQAHLPEEYRRLQRTLPGLILTRDAVEDETDFVIPDWIVYVSGKVWKNLDTPWRSRKNADAVDFTFTALTNTVTLETPAEEADSYVMEVVHDSPYPEILKAIALDLCVDELYKLMPRLISADDYERWSINMQNKYAILRELRRGMIRVDEWDELNLLEENETITPQGKGFLNPNGW